MAYKVARAYWDARLQVHPIPQILTSRDMSHLELIHSLIIAQRWDAVPWGPRADRWSLSTERKKEKEKKKQSDYSKKQDYEYEGLDCNLI